MKILHKIYTKTFLNKDAAERFIEKHKDQKNFILSFQYCPMCWKVEKYKNWAD
jgi:hypothetical protein